MVGFDFPRELIKVSWKFLCEASRSLENNCVQVASNVGGRVGER